MCAARDFIAGGLWPRPLPLRFHVVDRAGHAHRLQLCECFSVQRQTRGQALQRLQIEPIGLNKSFGCALAFGVGEDQRHVATWPVQTVGGVKGECLCGDFKALGILFPGQMPLQRLELHRFQLRTQGQAQVFQAQIGPGFDGLSVQHIDQQVQAPFARGHVDAGGHAARHRGQVDLGQLGLEGARPVLPTCRMGRQQAAAKLPRGMPIGTPAFRWRGLHLHIVAARAVAQRDVDRVHCHRAPGLQRQSVRPVHGALAQHDFFLRQQPIGCGRGCVGAAGQGQAGDPELPVLGAAQVQFGAVQGQLLDAERQQRLSAQRDAQFGQGQGGLAGAVVDAQVVDLQHRRPAVGLHGQFADQHGQPHRLAGHVFKLRAQLRDSRHNPKMQYGPCQPHEHAQAQQAPCEPAQKQSRQRG